MTNNWVKQGNNYFLREVSQNTPKMEKGVYKVNCNPQTGEIYVTEIQQSFDFPYKIYGMENKFIDRVIRTYNETTGNMGMLLNGVKGTGKTVTSKQICNKLNLPVLLIHEAYNGLPSFLNEVQQDVVVLIDEFEKIYADRDHTVLTVMDGVMDNGFRKVFILTTNSLYVNDNLIQRPGRIRYLKTYSDLTLDVITEIVDDKLIHTEHRKATIDFLSNLETITVDIVKAIVE
jgi:SpoVK/Ycf46/Vps4 family AAA+-type ATPase